MKTKTIEIDWNGEKRNIVMKRLSFGELNQLTEESTDIKVVNGQPIVNVSQKKLKELSILKSIIEAPFTISINEIQNLDSDLGNTLFETFSQLNQSEEKKNP
jgi:hypothetical protein